MVGDYSRILDFTGGTDKLVLDPGVFAAAGPTGPMATAAFFMGRRAHDADDRIIYNGANGKVMYDADGNGAGAAVTFARVTVGLTLTASDFEIG